MWIYAFFKNHPRRGVFRNVNLSNLENVLQKNRRTDLAEECIFRASGGTNFENFCDLRQPWCRPLEFDVCTGLPKKLWIRHFQQINRIVQVTFSYFKLNTKWTYCGLRVRNKYVKVMKVTFYEGYVLSFRVRHNKIPGRIGSTSFRERKRERERESTDWYRKIMLFYVALWVKVGISINKT